ncbi:hypothetical protein [Roseovarius atlanticus]|uniref:hypothetical protein n=1 Tax=Roseovarius atlanticus TaxID=1641875 RepID=UPI001C9642B7|nr:hypothetical protein [Roseovarius atlanticus]MBY5990213.1 hypothetical protein [Roseovarius atlanticus]MBY6126759.1 hypothetical protein [Roseovarius atlanticus]MBY6151252.1 hypothetical protein [Roseovarius atlanticus]
MTEFLKDLAKAWDDRIRSPFLGSVAIVFVIYNWKPLFYLVFAEVKVTEKFKFFDENTDECSLFWWPLLVGVGLAFAAPWLKLFGAWLARSPSSRLKRMQGDSSREHRIEEFKKSAEEESAKAALEDAREKRQIAAARRKQEAEELDDDQLIEELETERERGTTSLTDGGPINALISQMSQFETAIIKALGEKEQGGLDASDLVRTESYVESVASSTPNFTSIRLGVETQSALADLKRKRLISEGFSGDFTLTKQGYEVFDKLNAK